MIYETKIIIEGLDDLFIAEYVINDLVKDLNVGDTVQNIVNIIKIGKPDVLESTTCEGKITRIINCLARDGYTKEAKLVRVITVRPNNVCYSLLKDICKKYA